MFLNDHVMLVSFLLYMIYLMFVVPFKTNEWEFWVILIMVGNTLKDQVQ